MKLLSNRCLLALPHDCHCLSKPTIPLLNATNGIFFLNIRDSLRGFREWIVIDGIGEKLERRYSEGWLTGVRSELAAKDPKT